MARAKRKKFEGGDDLNRQVVGIGKKSPSAPSFAKRLSNQPLNMFFPEALKLKAFVSPEPRGLLGSQS